MEQISIDHPFPEDKFREYEGPILRFTKAGFEIIIFVHRLTEKEITSYSNERVKYGLYTSVNVPFFAGLFAKTEYLDSSFNIRVMPADEAYTWLKLKPTSFNFYLVDSETYLVKVMKQYDIAPAFMDELISTLTKQMLYYVDGDEVDGAISYVHSLHRSSKDLFKEVKHYFYT